MDQDLQWFRPISKIKTYSSSNQDFDRSFPSRRVYRRLPREPPYVYSVTSASAPCRAARRDVRTREWSTRIAERGVVRGAVRRRAAGRGYCGSDVKTEGLSRDPRACRGYSAPAAEASLWSHPPPPSSYCVAGAAQAFAFDLATNASAFLSRASCRIHAMTPAR